MPDALHSSFTVRPASWQEDHDALAAIREQVFMQEQSVPAELEWDDEDDDALHLLAVNSEMAPIGTARMLKDGHIGRVAVVPQWRGRGVATTMMQQLHKIATSQGHDEVFLDAQVDALPFYEGLGYIAVGEVFMDAGIPHRHMRCALRP